MRLARSVLLVAASALLVGQIELSRASGQDKPKRSDRGLLVLYDFAQPGQTVRDRSGVGTPLDLAIENASSVKWMPASLKIESSVLIASPEPARKIIDAVKRSNAISVEAWVTPANTSQTGPARIVSLSASTVQRNVTLGQDKDLFDVRLRSTAADNNGLPSTSSPKKSLQTRPTHVVFTRDAAGSALIFIDGKRVADKKVGGNFGNWDAGHRLVLANELTKDRAWLGELHLVAVYDRALTDSEVQQNFAAGAGAVGDLAARPAPRVPTAFETAVAPLFARHCLECHDAAVKKGGLDLSRKAAALAGGESGTVITPGKSSESLLWDYVESDDMPKDRPPLSAGEKAALRTWLDSGAAWPIELIDPANYLNEGHAGEVWVQRLTVPEYIETVRSAVGVDISKEARQLLPPDLRADGFSNTAYNLNIDLKHVEAYGQLAEIIVSRMDTPAFASRFSKSRQLDVDKMPEMIAAMGKWLLRGPVNDQEINYYRGIASTVSSAGGDYDEAVRYIIEAMLQSPRFIYRLENNRGDGGPRPTNLYELASRLSYILWGAPPDEALLRAAESGELADRQKVAQHVQRMLKDPRAVARSEQFIAEWLDLGRLDDMRPDGQRFPDWDPQLAADMRTETLAFFNEVVWKQNRPLSDLLNAQVTFATPRLARHYGLKVQGDKGLTRYDLSSTGGRGGLLTHGSVLTVGGDDASMVSRGLFVLHELLRGTVNAPPPCVNTTPPPTKAGLTQRGIAESRVANQNCGICHGRFEPLAFGLEKFDGVGAYHDVDEHGNKLRDDGEVLFPGQSVPVKYSSTAELMNLLADSDRVRESMTWKVTQFALGRPLVAADAPIVSEIHQAAQKGGGTYASLITAIVMSDLVQMTRTEKDPS